MGRRKNTVLTSQFRIGEPKPGTGKPAIGSFPQASLGGYHNEEGDYGVALECYDFLCAVRDRRPPEIDGWAGLAAQAVPEAFFESSHLGEAVRIADVVSGEVDGYQAEINERWGL